MQKYDFNDYVHDLCTYLPKYIKAFKLKLDDKSIKKLENDRRELFEAEAIKHNEGLLYNESLKFSKICVTTYQDLEKGQFTYIDKEEVVEQHTIVYHEPYYSKVTIILNPERTDIVRIFFHFSFRCYKPWRDSIDLKLNQNLMNYALNCAMLQFKALWTGLYCISLSAGNAVKEYKKAIDGSNVSLDMDGIHLTITSNDTLNLKSKTGEYGEFICDANIDFDTITHTEEEPNLEEIYYKMLVS